MYAFCMPFYPRDPILLIEAILTSCFKRYPHIAMTCLWDRCFFQVIQQQDAIYVICSTLVQYWPQREKTPTWAANLELNSGQSHDRRTEMRLAPVSARRGQKRHNVIAMAPAPLGDEQTQHVKGRIVTSHT